MWRSGFEMLHASWRMRGRHFVFVTSTHRASGRRSSGDGV